MSLIDRLRNSSLNHLRYRLLHPPPPLTPVLQEWDQPFDNLRRKWTEVPTYANQRGHSESLLDLDDAGLLAFWEQARTDLTTGVEYQHRGWYHDLYSPQLAGKKVMDVGSGLGFDSITFAQHGAQVTFVDLAPTNLAVIERMCGLFGIRNANFVLLTDLDALKPLDMDYDFIMAMGSMHHAPRSIIKPECAELLKHLKIGGRWLQLAYPRARWRRDGRRSPNVWGQITDGPNTPWADWLDVPTLLNVLSPASFELVLYYEFHNLDYNWFDLKYLG